MDCMTIYPLIGISLTAEVVMLASIAMIAVLKKIPFVRNFVP